MCRDTFTAIKEAVNAEAERERGTSGLSHSHYDQQSPLRNEGGIVIRETNRREAIRARCIDCSGGNRAEVRNCEFTDCPLWPFRMGTGKQDPRARDKAIRAYCSWCANGQKVELDLCPSGGCPLFPYRKTGANGGKRHIETIPRDKNFSEGER